MSKVFVLRTHALLSSRRSTLRFGNDNEIVVPLSVVDELRKMKHQSFEKARIAKDLFEYFRSFPAEEIISKDGVKQENGSILRIVDNFHNIDIEDINYNQLTKSERRTLQICLGIKQQEGKNVVLVTNNITLQLLAEKRGVTAENFKDEVFPRLSEQYTGREEIFTRDDIIDLFYQNKSIEVKDIFNNSEIEFVENKFFVISSPQNKSALGMFKKGKIVMLNHKNAHPYGIRAKNVGQKFVLEALLDDDCPLVVIKGNAGTGKTFCALAAGLDGVWERKAYSRILVTRSVTAIEQYGFLPGDIEKKLSPYLAGIKDNLSILINGPEKREQNSKINFKSESETQEDGSYYFENKTVQIQAIGFLRGRSIVDTYFIIDETQNIEPDTIKSIVTRAGEGSKFIFLGDPTQVDNPNLTERYNGLVYLSEKMKGNPMCAQISLLDDESVRSKLAREAAKIL